VLFKLIASYTTTLMLLFLLSLGAAIATFVENDFGTATARFYVYNALWYETLLILTALNIIAVVYRTNMFLHVSRFAFHIAFVLIVIGSGLTRYLGVDGVMKVRENGSATTIFSADKNKEIPLPFSVHLKAFELTRYYGSNSPFEYASWVRIVDGNSSFEDVISMNNTLSYKGYKFFQTFYDPDEKGTILSITKDPGMEVTYVGYALLFLGLILNFFDPKSRFRLLSAQLKNGTFMLLFLICSQTPLFSNSEYVETYLKEHRENSVLASEHFGALVVQSRMGRMKPFDSLSKEVLYKLSGQSALLQMSPTQVMLGMLSHPKVWKKLPMIQTKTPKLRVFLGLEAGQKLASFEDFFEGSRYKLETEVQHALMKRPSERGTYENDVIKVDERLSIAFMTYYGTLFKIFPLPEDANHTWLGFPEMFEKLQSEGSDVLKQSAQDFIEALFARDYSKARLHVKVFETFAQAHGASIMPSSKRVRAELFFNQARFFERLTPAYLLLGVLLLGLAFVQVFRHNSGVDKAKKPLFYATAFLFSIHTFALLLRWYVSGHAPMSDTYESIIYIAWSCLLFSMVFLRSSVFALAGSTVMAAIFMFVAHLGTIDPEITNLVPVLKSFWLLVHVSVITASYGFLALGCALGFFTLIVFTCKLTPQSIQAIKQLSVINEVSLIVGLTLLVIGNFLGGIWANESWGRYWGWDPKETWAYISIIVYTIILHVRLIPKWYSRYLFAVLSILGFASILMTYFGVNFYLAGMHSYATGDPVPVPIWVYVASALVVSLIVLSYKNKHLKEEI